MLVSKKEQYGKYKSCKYFIGCNDNDVIRPLYLELSQMTDYVNKFNEIKNKNKNKNKIKIKTQQQCLLWLKIKSF